MISHLIPDWYFSNELTVSEFKNIFQTYTFNSAIITLCFSFPSIILIKAQTNSVNPNVQEYETSFCVSLGKLFKNRSFIWLFLSYSPIHGIYYCKYIILHDYYKLYEMEDDTIKYYLTVFNCLGIVSTFLFTINIPNSKRFRKVYVYLNFFLIIGYIGLTIFLELFLGL